MVLKCNIEYYPVHACVRFGFLNSVEGASALASPLLMATVPGIAVTEVEAIPPERFWWYGLHFWPEPQRVLRFNITYVYPSPVLRGADAPTHLSVFCILTSVLFGTG